MNNLSRKEQYFYGPAMPLFNSGNWNPDLHPRNSIGEFIYTDGGLHGRSPSGRGGSNPKAKGSTPSAIKNALALPINLNTKRSSATATNPCSSHYGYGDDKTPDTNSNKRRLGNHSNTLTALSLSISLNVAHANGLKVGNPVYVNGIYLGQYDDSPAKWVNNTIDIYDPSNLAGSQNWGGMVNGGAKISSSP
jgi:hypothetical protein